MTLSGIFAHAPQSRGSASGRRTALRERYRREQYRRQWGRGHRAESGGFLGRVDDRSGTARRGVARGSAPPALSAHGDMGSGWGSEITITQDASTLTVVYTYFHPRDMQPPFTFKYPLNGSASRTP